MKKNIKVVTVIGARPQFIKAAIVSPQLEKKGIREIVVHTGQHYDFNMSDVFFSELKMKEPDYYLNIGSSSHGEQTGRMLIELEKVLLKEAPHLVMVYGDTNSTLAGALAASKLHIPAAHVEAGLRSFNKKMPEELNRILTDHVSHFLFSPTPTGLKNLKNEGFSSIFPSAENLPSPPYPAPLCVNVGDVMYDIALHIKKQIDEPKVLESLELHPKEFLLATVHRAENTDDTTNLESIFLALMEVAHQGKTIFFPLHPRTRKILEKNRFFNRTPPKNLILHDPVSYSDMIVLESSARLIFTDSGGVQKEGYFFHTPCVIPRDQTEWTELLDEGWVKLTGANKEKIVDTISGTWESDIPPQGKSLFGDGCASQKIAKILETALPCG